MVREFPTLPFFGIVLLIDDRIVSVLQRNTGYCERILLKAQLNLFNSFLTSVYWKNFQKTEWLGKAKHKPFIEPFICWGMFYMLEVHCLMTLYLLWRSPQSSGRDGAGRSWQKVGEVCIPALSACREECLRRGLEEWVKRLLVREEERILSRKFFVSENRGNVQPWVILNETLKFVS